ncbi:hypothetical protein D9613_009606 [Agrocybe pediades]|uniref:NADH:flavin oxidoreductase/NADH oxidase N-terminal domain-containing protein n=1 Tax=Agrocybe pediades TaxID=84607 RepID=A0A8H4R2K3_9AGAR|nr:hypothetical protein D9613_009606 [Agrocybe pediades]
MSQAEAAPNVNVAAPNVPYFTPLQDPPSGSAVASGQPIPKLFQPLRLRGLEFQNRIFLSPLCQYSSKDGLVNPWIFAHLGGIVSRGPGLTFTEAAAVLPNGRTTPEDAGIWSDEHAKAFKPIVEFAHSQNQKIGIQLAHAGRKASCIAPFLDGDAKAGKELGGWPDNVWGPTTVPFHETYPNPKEMTKEQIKEVTQAFVDSAKRAVDVGFDVIEIHSAHGYLLSSFLCPTSNTRKDEYGGENFENRIRLLVEVVKAVRGVIPESMPLFVRISATEWLEHLPDVHSWKVEDAARLAPILASLGVDLLDISAGGNDPRQKVRPGPQYQVGFAHTVKSALPAGTKTLVSAVGGLHVAKDAYEVLETGKADVVFVGRQFQRNPGLVWDMAEELGVQVNVAKQIGWGFRGRGKKGLGWGRKEAEKEDSKL